MTTHTASCRCGQLTVAVSGEPVRVSVCHCLNCKKRSGSAFAVQVRFSADAVEISGRSNSFAMAGDSGKAATFHFCPECGSDVYYLAPDQGSLLAIPLGAFADPFAFAPPEYSVYEGRKLEWVEITGDDVAHMH